MADDFAKTITEGYAFQGPTLVLGAQLVPGRLRDAPAGGIGQVQPRQPAEDNFSLSEGTEGAGQSDQGE